MLLWKLWFSYILMSTFEACDCDFLWIAGNIWWNFQMNNSWSLPIAKFWKNSSFYLLYLNNVMQNNQIPTWSAFIMNCLLALQLAISSMPTIPLVWQWHSSPLIGATVFTTNRILMSMNCFLIKQYVFKRVVISMESMKAHRSVFIKVCFAFVWKGIILNKLHLYSVQ